MLDGPLVESIAYLLFCAHGGFFYPTSRAKRKKKCVTGVEASERARVKQVDAIRVYNFFFLHLLTLSPYEKVPTWALAFRRKKKKSSIQSVELNLDIRRVWKSPSDDVFRLKSWKNYLSKRKAARCDRKLFKNSRSQGPLSNQSTWPLEFKLGDEKKWSNTTSHVPELIGLQLDRVSRSNAECTRIRSFGLA